MAKVYVLRNKVKNMKVLDIADFFIAFANITGDVITNLKLQKLCYYAQAWHLAIYGRPLFEEDFQAWVHGPVEPGLYGEYKRFRWQPIFREDLDEKAYAAIRDSFGNELCEFMDEVVEEYFGIAAYDLERLTHSEDPWKIARQGLPEDALCTNVIDKRWMQDYYQRFLEQ